MLLASLFTHHRGMMRCWQARSASQSIGKSEQFVAGMDEHHEQIRVAHTLGIWNRLGAYCSTHSMHKLPTMVQAIHLRKTDMAALCGGMGVSRPFLHCDIFGTISGRIRCHSIVYVQFCFRFVLLLLLRECRTVSTSTYWTRDTPARFGTVSVLQGQLLAQGGLSNVTEALSSSGGMTASQFYGPYGGIRVEVPPLAQPYALCSELRSLSRGGTLRWE